MVVCPVCCKKLKFERHTAYCDDDDGAWRYVGSDCWAKIRLAGAAGYKQRETDSIRWYANQQEAIAAIAKSR